MKSKTSPNLIRQALTNLGHYNFYVQKPFDTGYNFILMFKACYLLEVFLTAQRTINKYQFNENLHRKMKKNIYRLAAPSAYKFINVRLSKNYQNLNLFCNFINRNKAFPKKSGLLNLEKMHNHLKKRLKIYQYTFTLIRNKSFPIITAQIFYRNIKNGGNLRHKKHKPLNKYINLQKIHSFYKMKHLYYLYGKKNLGKKEWLRRITKKKFTLRTRQKKELLKWTQASILLNRVLLRPLKKRQTLKTKILLYHTKNFYSIKKKSQKNEKKKVIKQWWKLQCIKSKNFLIRTRKFLKTVLKKAIKNQKWAFIEKYKRNSQNIILKKKINNSLAEIQYKKKNPNISTVLINFWYIFIFNKILEHKIKYFFNEVTKIKYFDIYLQQEFSFPKTVYFLKMLNNKVKRNTQFLKHNKKFYNTFVNIMPALQTFYTIEQITQQLAIELSRTKKHWRVIRGMELILMQTLIQIKKEPINNKSALIGLRITITGRPNKISRTQKIILQYGKITKASFTKNNIFSSFSSSKAKIGSFGITIVASM